MHILNTLLGGFVSWKTTLVGLITGIIALLNSLGVINITTEQQTTIVSFAVLLIGWLAKDNNKVGKATDAQNLDIGS